MKRARLALEGVVCALACLLALELGREVGQGEHDLVERAVQRTLAVLQVEEHADAGLDELLQGVGRLDLLATEPCLFGHDEDLERWPRLQRVHETNKSRAF